MSNRASDGLTARQRRAALALATGARQFEAAAAAGVNPRTVRTWETLPVFAAAVDEQQAAAAADDRRAVHGLTRAALDRLREIIQSGSDGAAVAACRDVLDRTMGKPVAQTRLEVRSADLPPAKFEIEFVSPPDRPTDRDTETETDAADADTWRP